MIVDKALNIFRHDKRPMRRLMAAMIGRSGLGRWLKIKINIQDYQILFHPTGLSSLYWYDSTSRSEDYTFLKSFLKKGDTYIDIGANIGITVIPAAKFIGETGQCKAFEPHPKIYSYLKENVQLNGLEKIEIYNYALGNSTKDIYFTDHFTDEVNCVVEAPRAGKSIRVPMTTLDLMTADLEFINLLKIDVEGYEKFVLEGAKQTLAKVSCIYLEISEKNFSAFGYKTSDILQFLEDEGFKLLKRTSVRNEILKVDPSYLSRKLSYENLIAVRNIQDFESRTAWKVF